MASAPESGRTLASCRPSASVSSAVWVAMRTRRLEIDAVGKLAQEIGREHPALAAAGRGIARHGVHEGADARCRPGIGALGEDSRNGPCEHITRAGGRHAGIAALTEPRGAAGSADERTRTFQHNGAVVAIEQPIECCESIVLNLLRIDAQEPSRLAGMRCQDPVLARYGASLGEEVERIRIDHERLAARERRLERRTRPG